MYLQIFSNAYPPAKDLGTRPSAFLQYSLTLLLLVLSLATEYFFKWINF